MRFRFRRDSSPKQSITAIASAITTGEEALTLLRSVCNGSRPALNTLLSNLEHTHASAALESRWRALQQTLAQPAPLSRQYQTRHLSEVRSKIQQTPPTGPGLEAHPLPLESINSPRRRVPDLVITANGGIPLLRYPGRQPPWFRRIITQQTRRSDRMIASVQKLTSLAHSGELEDEWDTLVRQQARAENVALPLESAHPHFEDSWASLPAEQKEEIWATYHERGRQWSIRGWELWQIVKREKWLAEKEGLPYVIASAIQSGQRLQVAVLQCMAQHGRVKPKASCTAASDTTSATANAETVAPESAVTGPITGHTSVSAVREARTVHKPSQTTDFESWPYSNFTPRPKETSKALIRECLVCAPLVVPTKWSEKVVETEPPEYLRPVMRKSREYQRKMGRKEAVEDRR